MSLQIILKNSAVSGKEPTASQLANGELALNYHADGPFLTCKDTAGVVRRVSGVWISTTAPSTPTPGEFWLDISVNPAVLRVYKDSTDTWIAGTTVNAASTTTAGIVELATDAETQAGSDSVRAVTPASLQSKLSSATNSTSTTTIANSAAVKAAKDVADAALPKVGGTMTGQILGDDSTSPSTPGYAFDGDPDTGLLRTGADALALVTGGTSRLTISDAGVVTIPGDLTVNGTTTTINTENLVVEDKNIQLGTVGTPSDVTADGGGITLKGTTDKTLNWVDATDSWTSSENVNLASGKTYKINGTDVLSGSALGSGVTVGASQLSGTIPSTVLGNSTAYVGTTAVALNRSSANQGLTGISSVAMPGATSGTITITPAATAGTTAITVPSTSGTLVTTGDTGTVTSTMLANGTIVNEDINASAAIAGTKIAPNFGAQDVTTTGTSTAASFIPTSSTVPTNGVYLPATNSVALATNGTGRLFIDDTGRIGIGTGGTQTQVFQVESSADSQQGIWLRNTSTGTAAASNVLINSAAGQLALRAHSAAHSVWSATALVTTSTGLTGGLALNTGTTAPIVFFTNNTERARIDSSGRLGLGTSSVLGNIDIAGDDPVVYIRDTKNTTYSGGESFGRLAWYTNDASGIGAHETAYIRNVNSDAAVTPTPTLRFGVGANNAVAVDRMTLTSTGLGLGTASPVDLLHISSTTADAAAQVQTTFASGSARLNLYANSGGVSQIRFGDEGSVNIGLLTYDHTTDSMAFRTNGSERARIDSSGRLLLGTSTARSRGKIEVEGTTTLSASCSLISNAGATNGSSAYLLLGKSRGTTNGSYTLVASGDQLGGIEWSGTDGTALISAAQIRAEVDGTPGANDMPGRLVFSTTADGASSPTEQLRITSDRYIRLASGTGGIQFGGDTAAANALDDYEEGTWSVSFYDAASAGNVSATTGTGTYTKVGRLVTATFNVLNINTTGLTAGNVLYFTLPFASTAICTGSCFLGSVTVAGGVSAYVATNVRGVFYEYSSGNAYSALTVGDFTSGAADVFVTVTYNAS